MKNVLRSLGLFAVATVSVTAQEKAQLDRDAVMDMCGCYEISFRYSETFSPDSDYKKKENYVASALELALPIVEENDRISIQHLLIINDSTVIKHWRQDWLYENPEVFTYQKGRTWDFKVLPVEEVAGQWTQKVYQVDDSPRYSGSATWIHADGKHFWENETDSPLPRREYSKRDDYNVMIRGNRHEITSKGWNHEQDNDKIIREEGKEDMLLAQEKGMNTYTRVADEKCQAARDWWVNHSDFWSRVRAAWDEIYAQNGTLTLLKQVDEKPLYKHIAVLEERDASKEEISEVLNSFVQFQPATDTNTGQ